MQVRAGKEIGSCGCGRSPTGKCIGWHGLEEGEYRQRLAEYEHKQLQEALEQEKKNA
jgi:hypothetical protein